MKYLMVTAPILLALSVYFFELSPNSPELNDNAIVKETPVVKSTEELFPFVIAKNQSLYEILKSEGISSQEIFSLVDASKSTFNLSRLNPKQRIAIFKETKDDGSSELHGLQILIEPTKILKLEKMNKVWTAAIHNEKVETRIRDYQGIVVSSLWESATESGMDSELIVQLAEIFAWQIDFNRELRSNDRWRIVVEQEFVRGEPIGWGDILSAEYINEGELYQAVLFRQDGENIGYFDAEGESLRKMFLKSPIKFGRITSGFNRRRFHPILKIRRPHLGVDYGARRGTPVMAVGDGKVTLASWRGGAGNTIKIRHNSIYRTAYKHLHKFAKGIRPGKRVKQGQIIGYVGSTGLSTGPHLHYEFYKYGKFVDPLKQKFPSAKPVAENLKMAFLEQSKSFFSQLPDWNGVAVSASSEISLEDQEKQAL